MVVEDDVTREAVEPAFAALPGVDTAHFDAIAGLDCYRSVCRLFVISRRLPGDASLAPRGEAFFGNPLPGGFRWTPAGLWMRDGGSRTVNVQRRSDAEGEVLRPATCDDGMI